PNTGSDLLTGATSAIATISIHAPNTGSDIRTRWGWWFTKRFQSTLPIQGATQWCCCGYYGIRISIHAPNTGSDFSLILSFNLIIISIHAPNTGSDTCISPSHSLPTHFNPRSQYRERQRDIDKINTSTLHIVSFILFLPIE